MLHKGSIQPEKKMSDFSVDSFLQIIQVNTVLPLLWLGQLEHLIQSKQLNVTILSARVASIGDNRLGGWYSYRGSKAALNMMVKTAAIELKRKHKQWQFLLFHPGTTDTALSKPFQRNVPEHKLFTPEFTAQCLLAVEKSLSPSETIHYLDWQGEQIPW